MIHLGFGFINCDFLVRNLKLVIKLLIKETQNVFSNNKYASIIDLFSFLDQQSKCTSINLSRDAA